MSRHHANHTNEVQHMIMDVKNMSEEKLLATYNIEVWEGGKIYDCTEGMTYESALDWANSTIEEDDLDYDGMNDSMYTEEDYFQ